MNAVTTPSDDALRENKREMFDGMRAYHQSEISHANNAITMLLAIATAAGGVILAMLFPNSPVEHRVAIAWGLALFVVGLAFTIALTSTIKMGVDHKIYASYGEEYVKTSLLLGFYTPTPIAGEQSSIKTNRNIGQGTGYRDTQLIIWTFAGVLSALTLLFAIFSCHSK